MVVYICKNKILKEKLENNKNGIGGDWVERRGMEVGFWIYFFI